MNKKLILLPLVAMMLVGCNTKKQSSSASQPGSSASEEPTSSEPAPAPELVFSITRDSIPDLANEEKFDGSTYLADSAEFTVEGREFETSAGKTFGRAAPSFAAGSYELGAMQMKKADGYFQSKAVITGFSSLTVEFVSAGYETNAVDKFLVLNHKASAEGEFQAIAPKETGTLTGVDTGKKDSTPEKIVYKYVLHYENLTAGIYKFAAPAGNATYPLSFQFYK